ncbi:MAG: hypothetical protein MPJ50_18685 [Pirellulales bacterium]|nr:hypothetical protein [Pirellulales bacterium]
MDPPDRHAELTPHVSFDGGDLDCGNGLLLLIRKHIDPLPAGGLLEILSSESSVREDLPAWCRLTGNEMVSLQAQGDRNSYLVSKGNYFNEHEQQPVSLTMQPDRGRAARRSMPVTQPICEVTIPETLPSPVDAPSIAPFSAMGIGSWPRPQWLLRTLHEYLQGRLSEAEFQEAANDAVRLCVDAQVRAGVDVLTDGEQRRDDYSSFVGAILDNCQLIPITDLLPYVDHPEEFAAALKDLDVPADKVRHPAVYGPLSRQRPLAVHELQFVQSLSDAPVKVALPGPYLLTRTMWMECISDRAYESREQLADDIVRVLREELHHLLANRAAIVQFDEPVLTEVVHGRSEMGNRTFMCGALGSKGSEAEELGFAESLLGRVVTGLPWERLALHVCRGNWTTDESAALSGDYGPLLTYLSGVPVGTLFLETCTSRAGDLELLTAIPDDYRIGVGVINQKSSRIETVEEIEATIERAVKLLGAERIFVNPDCGFATFADNPITAARIAEAKLSHLAEAARRMRDKHC